MGKCAICSYAMGKYAYTVHMIAEEFIFQGTLPKHWMNLIWKNHCKVCKDKVQVSHLELLIIKSMLWWGFLFEHFFSRLYGDLWLSQIPLLNLRKTVLWTNYYSHLWDSGAMAQDMKCSCPDVLVQSPGCCRGSITISQWAEWREVIQPFD